MDLPETNGRGPERILVVDDVAANLAVLSATLEPKGFEILAASSGTEALQVALRAQPDLILLDVMMPGWDGFETCRQLKLQESTREIPIIFITARTETQNMVAGFCAGGVDYVVKPFEPEEVASRVTNHLRIGRLTRELVEKNRVLEARTAELLAEIGRRELAESALRTADDKLAVLSDMEASRWNLTGLVGGSAYLEKIVEDIRRLHQFAGTSVLITGESGTGKELIARAIHFGGARAKAPFVPVNCAAIPAELAESMLFGHLKGSFTGATADRKGYFEMADGGTIFLDEIGDMPAPLQAKLLRVLEDGQVCAVGATTPRKVDARVIAATNANLDQRIAAGTFRQDLFFRLARYLVATPPLRERSADIPLLTTHFLRHFAAEMGMKGPRLSHEAMEELKGYRFPGNVRELRNIIERALIESGGQTILARHLHLPQPVPAPVPFPQTKLNAESTRSLPMNLADAEEILIQRALQQTGGNIAEAARLLGIHRTRIYRKLAQEEISKGN